VTSPVADQTEIPGRILVVDDTPFNRQLLARLLRGLGHEPVEAGNGLEALERLRDEDVGPIDVILLDIVMPEMDGYETLAALRARGVSAPVCALTALAMTDDRARLLAAGFDGYLEKPVDVRALPEQVRALL